MLVIGNKNIIEELKNKSGKSVFEFGYEFHTNKNRTKGWLGQPSIIISLEQKFGKEAMKHRLGLAPGTPRFVAMRVTEDHDKLGTKEHATYRSGVGTLLYLTKHS